MTTLDIAGISVAPGTRRRHSIELTELADGTRVSIPLDLIHGAEPGPRLYLGAAIHGDEVDGVGILFRALADVDPKRLRGSIVCVPVQHPLSFHADHRLPISQFMKSPLDQAPADAWACFPGAHDGNLAQGLAATLFDMVKTCDFAIDIHTPTRGGRYVPIAILPHPRLGESHARAEAMAHAFGSGWIMRTDTGFYVADGILCVEATRAGVPAFTFETGEGGRLEEGVIDDGAVYIRNVMKWLKMIDGEPVRAREDVGDEGVPRASVRGAGGCCSPGHGSGTWWRRACTCAPSSTSTATRWRPSPRPRAGCSCARPRCRPSRAASGRRRWACFEPGGPSLSPAFLILRLPRQVDAIGRRLPWKGDRPPGARASCPLEHTGGPSAGRPLPASGRVRAGRPRSRGDAPNFRAHHACDIDASRC